MSARVEKRGGKFRVVEPTGRLVRNKQGTPVDGGGHESLSMAQSQARAINSPKAARKVNAKPKAATRKTYGQKRKVKPKR